MTEIDVMIRNNPKAAKHEESIRKAFAALRDLEQSGIESSGYELMSAYGAVNSAANASSKNRTQYSR